MLTSGVKVNVYCHVCVVSVFVFLRVIWSVCTCVPRWSTAIVNLVSVCRMTSYVCVRHSTCHMSGHASVIASAYVSFFDCSSLTWISVLTLKLAWLSTSVFGCLAVMCLTQHHDNAFELLLCDDPDSQSLVYVFLVWLCMRLCLVMCLYCVVLAFVLLCCSTCFVVRRLYHKHRNTHH